MISASEHQYDMRDGDQTQTLEVKQTRRKMERKNLKFTSSCARFKELFAEPQ